MERGDQAGKPANQVSFEEIYTSLIEGYRADFDSGPSPKSPNNHSPTENEDIKIKTREDLEVSSNQGTENRFVRTRV